MSCTTININQTDEVKIDSICSRPGSALMLFRHTIPAAEFFASCEDNKHYTFNFKMDLNDFRLAVWYYLTKMDLVGGKIGGDPRYLLKEEIDEASEEDGHLGPDQSLFFPLVPWDRVLVLEGSTYPKIVIEAPPASGGPLNWSFIYHFDKRLLKYDQGPREDEPIIMVAEIHFFAFAQVIRHILLCEPGLPKNDDRRKILKMIQALVVTGPDHSGRGWRLHGPTKADPDQSA